MLYLYLWYKEHSLPCLASPSSRSRYLACFPLPGHGTWPVPLLRGWGCCYFANLTLKPFGSAGWQVTGP